MFDFLISVFGGAFYYGMISSEKTLAKNREKKEEEIREFHTSISTTADEDAEIIKRLIRSDAKVKKDTLNSIASELEEIYGTNWYDYYLGTGEYWSVGNIYEPWGIAYNILASKISKIGSLAPTSYGLGHGLGEDGRRHVIKACEIIERNMQKKYPELKLWFVPGTKPSNKKYAEFYEEIWMGSLKWEHLLITPTKKCNPPIKRLW